MALYLVLRLSIFDLTRKMNVFVHRLNVFKLPSGRLVCWCYYLRQFLYIRAIKGNGRLVISGGLFPLSMALGDCIVRTMKAFTLALVLLEETEGRSDTWD